MCSARGGIQQNWAHHCTGEAAPRQCHRHGQQRGSRMGMHHGEGCYALATTSSPKPHRCLCPGQGPASPCGTLGMGRGSGVILGVSAQAEWPSVPIPMSWQGWPHAEGRRSHQAHSCPQLETHHAMAAHVTQPWGHRGFVPPKCRLKTGGKTQPG